MRRFYSRESDKRGLSSSISFKTLGIWTRDASEGATHGDRRFCFRFSRSQSFPEPLSAVYLSKRKQFAEIPSKSAFQAVGL
jgi:hypothetical protein